MHERRTWFAALLVLAPFVLGAGGPDCSRSKAVRVPGSTKVASTVQCTVTLGANILLELTGITLKKTVQCKSLDVTEDSAYCVPSANLNCKPLPPAAHYLLKASCAGLFVPFLQSPCRTQRILLGFLENYESEYCAVPPPVLQKV